MRVAESYPPFWGGAGGEAISCVPTLWVQCLACGTPRWGAGGLCRGFFIIYKDMVEEINEKLKGIKRSFRSVMNGVASHSMREKGVGYKLNWGVSLVHLREMADNYGKDYDLAIALWKEDIRECKILATLIMPADQLLPEVADIWLEQTASQEMAEMLAANLLKDVS